MKLSVQKAGYFFGGPCTFYIISGPDPASSAISEAAPVTWNGQGFSANFSGDVTINGESFTVHYSISGSVTPLGDEVVSMTTVYSWVSNFPCGQYCIVNFDNGGHRIEAHNIRLDGAGDYIERGAASGSSISTITKTRNTHRETAAIPDTSTEHEVSRSRYTYKSSTYDDSSSVSVGFN